MLGTIKPEKRIITHIRIGKAGRTDEQYVQGRLKEFLGASNVSDIVKVEVSYDL